MFLRYSTLILLLFHLTVSFNIEESAVKRVINQLNPNQVKQFTKLFNSNTKKEAQAKAIQKFVKAIKNPALRSTVDHEAKELAEHWTVVSALLQKAIQAFTPAFKTQASAKKIINTEFSKVNKEFHGNARDLVEPMTKIIMQQVDESKTSQLNSALEQMRAYQSANKQSLMEAYKFFQKQK